MARYLTILALALIAVALSFRHNPEFIDFAPYVMGAIALPWSLVSFLAPDNLTVLTLGLVGGFLLNLAVLYWLGSRTGRHRSN